MRSSIQNFSLTIPGCSMNSLSSKRRLWLDLLLQPGVQRQSPAQRIGARQRFRSKTQLLEPPPNRARTSLFAGLTPTWGFSLSAGRKRVVDLVLLRGDSGGLWLALHGASDGFLGGAIVEVLDLLVVLGFPVDEHADGDE